MHKLIYMNSFCKFIHFNSPILVQRHLFLSLTVFWYHHPPMHNYCRINSNYIWTVFFRFGTKKNLFLWGSWKIIVTKLINLPLFKPLNSQRLIKNKKSSFIILALKVRMTMGKLWTLQRWRLSPVIFYKRFLSVHPFTGQVKCWMIPSFVFVHALILPNCGGKKRKYQFTLIMGASPRIWFPFNFWIIWKQREILLTRPY